MFTLIVFAAIAWFAYRHFAKKKRAADIRNWSVDFRNDKAIRPITRRLPWRNL
jgi:cbb3-type cytochrome oxidase subunit 3